MDNQVFDYQDALKRCCDDESFLKELLIELVDSYKDTIDIFDAAYKIGDNEKISSAAHSLKGSLRNLSALKSADILYEIELLGKTENLEEFNSLREKAVNAFLELKEVIDEVLNS